MERGPVCRRNGKNLPKFEKLSPAKPVSAAASAGLGGRDWRLPMRAGDGSMPIMVKRSSFEEGHRRKFLVVIDDTEECKRAVAYAAKRAERTSGALDMLYVIQPGEFQHWLGVENIMRAEAYEAAEVILSRAEDHARTVAPRVDAERVIREGTPSEAILSLIEEDKDVAILVLAAGTSTEGPGPLVSTIAGKIAGSFPIPVTVVPGTLSDDDIATLA